METWSFRMSNRISSMCFFPTSFGSTPWKGGEEREERRERRGEGGRKRRGGEREEGREGEEERRRREEGEREERRGRRGKGEYSGKINNHVRQQLACKPTVVFEGQFRSLGDTLVLLHSCFHCFTQEGSLW